MSKHKREEDKIEGETFSVVLPVASKAPEGVTPGTIFIENKLGVEIDITLTDGTNIHMAPWSRGSDSLNRSRAFPKKLLPAYAKRLASKGEIAILAAGGK